MYLVSLMATALTPTILPSLMGALTCILNVYLLLVYVIVVYVLSMYSTLTEVFPCFFLSCKSNARVNVAKTGHGPHSHKLLCSSTSMYCLFCVVLCIVCV